MDAQYIIDFTEPLQEFLPSQWIGLGKTYPKDPPLFIEDARQYAFQLPVSLSTQLLPHMDLSVADFVNFKLPAQTTALISAKPEAWFSKDAPCTDPAVLCARQMPSVDVLSCLNAMTGQQWFDGMQSIRDPCFNNGQERFPLYALGLWSKLAQMSHAQRKWQEARVWLMELISSYAGSEESTSMIRESHDLLFNIGWGVSIETRNVKTTTLDLTRLLGSRWLSDTLLDLMVHHLNARLLRDEHLSETMIGSLEVIREIRRGDKDGDYKSKRCGELLRIEKCVLRGATRLLYFAACIRDNHWITFQINFEDRTISYGDSLPMSSKPQQELASIQKWLLACFGWKYTVHGLATLQHAIQNDTNNCGICAINTIEHNVFGDSLWQAENAAHARLRWFTCLATGHVQRRTIRRVDELLNPNVEQETTEQVSKVQALNDDVACITNHSERPESTQQNTCCEISQADNAGGSADEGHNLENDKGDHSATSDTSGTCDDDDGSSDGDGYETETAYPSDNVSGLGGSRSSVSAKKNRAAVKSGTFQWVKDKVKRWKEKVKEYDPRAEFRKNDFMYIRCSKCGEFKRVKEPYDVSGYRLHHKKCKGKGVSSLFQLPGWGLKNSANHKKNMGVEVPCPGLTELDDERIRRYLRRTAVIGGGGKSIVAVAKKKYNKTFSKLSLQQKRVVLKLQVSGHKWRNEHSLGRVVATDCERHVYSQAHWMRAWPCIRCSAVLRNKRFTQSINKEPPDDKNYKFINEKFRNAALGHLFVKTTGLRNLLEADSSVSPFLRYASGVLEGKYNPAERLGPMSETIIRELIALKIKVASYSCDGTSVERSVQELLITRADTRKTYKITDPRKGSKSKYELTVHVAVFEDCPVAMIQDSKHALKTFRNNLFSGARVITNGNFVSMYRTIRGVAYEEDSPLYHRDVEKLDRQDDNAASRLFSATTLEHLISNHPDSLGEIVYLFIFGELVDAYQNRFITHSERLGLILRAHYFLNMWQTYLQEAGYDNAHYFLSREAVDITRILIEGLFALIMVYRDTTVFHSHGPFPLLPWLHSSEPCEHVFGCARQVVKDFTALDLYYMIRKLRIKIRDAVLLAESSDPKRQAQGYNHTYFDTRQINMRALATYPSDVELDNIALDAFGEAESVMMLLGVLPSLVHDCPLRSRLVGPRSVLTPSHDQDLSTAGAPLPSIASWYSDDVQDDISDDGEDVVEMQRILVYEQTAYNTDDRTSKEDDKLLSLTLAAVSLSMDDMGKVAELPDVTPEAEEEILADECRAIHNVFRGSAKSLPPIQAQDEPEKPFGMGMLSGRDLDLTQLVKLRTRHQTLQAANGVRTRSATQDPEKSLRFQLVREFHGILRAQQGRGIGTGREREMRWCETSGKDDSITGNAANAASVSKAAASRNIGYRKRVFTEAGLSTELRTIIVDARVSQLTPLRVDSYGFVLLNVGLTVAKVLAIYVKTSGKNGRHASVDDCQTIGAVSYLAVQLYEPFGTLNQFRSVTRHTTRFQTFQFGLLPSTVFFAALKSAPKIQMNSVIVNEGDWLVYRLLSDAVDGLTSTTKLFRRRKVVEE